MQRDITCTDRAFQRMMMNYLGMAYDLVVNPGPAHWPEHEIEADEVYRTTMTVLDYRVKYTLYVSIDIGSMMLLTERID